MRDIPSNYSIEEYLRLYNQNIPPELLRKIYDMIDQYESLEQENDELSLQLDDYQELLDSGNDMIEALEKRVEILEDELGKHSIEIPSG